MSKKNLFNIFLKEQNFGHFCNEKCVNKDKGTLVVPMTTTDVQTPSKR